MEEARRYRWDESAWPLVRVAAPRLPSGDAEFGELLAWYTGLARAGRPFVMLFELGLGAPLDAARRDQLRRHTREHDALIATTQRGLAIVARAAFQRATARALFWIIKPPYPVEIFGDWPAAETWAKARVPSAPPANEVG